ncbi:helix-turn-helix domain-containing protein [Citricoccus sp. GCM10030269]|uniref:helix-turn-helix domain-containing protein n=1 Tax=Citricoccus sp. GCM10030269 TaxID=3273388 RepID=UPI0036074C87
MERTIAPSEHLGHIAVSTGRVKAREQFDYWHSLLVRHYVDVDIESSARLTPETGYSGRMHRTDFGGCSIDEVTADPIRVNRSASSIRRHPGDYYQVAVLVEGEGMVMQDGRTARQKAPGDFFVFDTERPYIFDFLGGRTRQALFKVPKELVDAELPDLGSLTAVAVRADHGISRLASQLLLSLSQNDEARSDQASYSAVTSALTLAVTALREQTGAGREQRPAEALLADARMYISRHVADPRAVTPRQIASAVNISERYLFKLFEQAGTTPVRWARALRLDRAHNLLEDPAGHRSVKETAHAVGFSSPAHFSRAFTARFGQSPSDVREAARKDARISSSGS